ncbi:hypothetical protein DDD_1781 [Nonlabens dokdonensis DSW-6]|uniref:Uncharacterized protein n=1 Tax=Nonlabens dokdonensis (strain DSM 17205 / KCTC 12402 / DSW-6) TaxID=592029 RepID=L7WDF3_NONDD|nr:hypothetical protein DDD_1781 [Nonlabens dokdonensis DSW-6]
MRLPLSRKRNNYNPFKQKKTTRASGLFSKSKINYLKFNPVT